MIDRLHQEWRIRSNVAISLRLLRCYTQFDLRNFATRQFNYAPFLINNNNFIASARPILDTQYSYFIELHANFVSTLFVPLTSNVKCETKHSVGYIRTKSIIFSEQTMNKHGSEMQNVFTCTCTTRTENCIYSNPSFTAVTLIYLRRYGYGAYEFYALIQLE